MADGRLESFQVSCQRNTTKQFFPVVLLKHSVMATLVFNTAMLTIVLCLASSYYGAYGSDHGTCSVAGVTGTPRKTSRIMDITHAYREDMPVADSSEGLGNPIKLIYSMKNGSLYNLSEMKMIVHTGTHVDSPAHFFQEHYDAGFDVDTLDLELLNGPALLVDVPRDTNITAKVMEALHIPRGVQRVLFRTLNTDRRLMWKRDFDTSFVGFMEDGAQWLVENTDIKLVGVDYLSAAAFDNLAQSHYVFLANKDIILVEALKLDDVEVGIYSLHCLPLRLISSEGSPIRCILIR